MLKLHYNKTNTKQLKKNKGKEKKSLGMSLKTTYPDFNLNNQNNICCYN